MIRDLVLRLHLAGRYEHVIAVLEAALIHGQSEPWMYEVLALSMQLAHRPQEEIERVLLSRVDFTATDLPNLLYTAAYLTRFGGDRLALKLYRQASRIEPTRPEPYVLGLDLAQRLKDHEAVAWAAAGILAHAWMRGYETLHRRAENAAAQAAVELEKQGLSEQAEQVRKAVAEARRRDLIVELSWSGDADLDLIVEEPLGTLCSLQNPQSPGGGVHVRDGFGPDPANCKEQYICAFGAPGEYQVRVRHVTGRVVGNRAQLRIVRYQGSPDEMVRTLSLPLDRRDKVVRVSLHQGRRTSFRTVGIDAALATVGGLGHPRTAGIAAAGTRADRARFLASRRRRAMAAGASVGFQPVISVVADGVTSTAMAVVSGDRRYVRLSVSPLFTTLSDVFTFSFVQGAQPTVTPGVGAGPMP